MDLNRSVLICSLAFAFSASGAQLFTNGDFESGSLAGWTVVSTASSDDAFSVRSTTISPTGYPTVGAHGGTNFALSDASGLFTPEKTAIYQTIAIPAGTTSAVLAVSMFVNDQVGSAGLGAQIAIWANGANPLTTAPLYVVNSADTSVSGGVPNSYVSYSQDIISHLTPGSTYLIGVLEGDSTSPIQVGIDDFSLTTTGGAVVATPTFSPVAGTYSSAQNVTISTTTSGASIRYTTDGSTPTSTVGTLYTNTPIAVSSSLVLKAIAYAPSLTDSAVASAAYIIGGSSTSFLTGYALSNPTLRNDYTGWVGMQLTVGSSPLTVTALGRVCVAGNTQTHTVKFVNASTGVDVTGGSAAVNMAGCTPGQFAYTGITSLTLPAGSSYYLASQETVGGDQWYHLDNVSSTTAATVNGAIYTSAGSWISGGFGTISYVPPNFLYSAGPATVATPTFSPVAGTYSSAQNVTISTTTSGASIRYTTDGSTPTSTVGTLYTNTPIAVSSSLVLKAIAYAPSLTDSAVASAAYIIGGSSTSFLTGYALSNPTLRNDYTGWVGMQLTVGSSPLTVTALGRVCVAGNTQTHTVKFTNGSTGVDVTGGSAAVNMAGCTPGQFAYTPITPLTLPAGSSYYLASQETVGGDQWYHLDNVSSTTAATVNGAIWNASGSWNSGGFGTVSYVPPNFLYSTGSGPTITATVQTSPSGRSFSIDGSTFSATQVQSWTSGASHTIATTSPQSTGTGTQQVWSSWSDGGAISHSVTPTSTTTYTANFATQYLLTTGVSPSASGSIAASPSSANGYYNSGTAVQLTASPASGCTFQSWSGALSGSTNPQSVTMSAPQTVTANFQCSGGGSTSFLTGYALSNPTLRNDYTGWVGMQLTVGSSPLTVTALGRVCVAGNTQTHTVKFVNASTGVDVTGGSAAVNMAGCTPGQFAYTGITSLTLPAGSSYYLASQETVGGDQWYHLDNVSSTTAATVNGAIYTSAGSWISGGFGTISYVPPNFLYSAGPATVATPTFSPVAGTYSSAQNVTISTTTSGASIRYTTDGSTPTSTVGTLYTNTPIAVSSSLVLKAIAYAPSLTDSAVASAAYIIGGSSTSFLTGYALSNPTLRNDYTGWVGMQLTVGSSPLTVTALGRVCVAGNTQTHTVKFTNGSTGVDVTGGSAAVNMAGCTPGQFAYTPITPLTLPAGSSYYLASQETVGGDQWYHLDNVSSTTAATVNGAIWNASGSWNSGGFGTVSYVPPNFQYQ